VSAGRAGVTAALHALVVDDDVAIRLLVTRILERRDFVVDSARDGAEAIQKLASEPYDVILLDLMMPRVDGAGVMKFLSEYHPDQLATVIVMTAFGAGAAEQISPPPARFLQKPFDIRALVAEINDCVAGTGGQP
jgi:CheY-like chemotaxis protein